MNGGKLALGETVKMGAKILAVDAVSTGVAYGTSEICQAMGCPEGLTLVLSMLAGMGSSARLGSKVFGSGGLTLDDIAYQKYWNEVASGNHLPPGMTAEEYAKYLGGLRKVDDVIALNKVDYDEVLKVRKAAGRVDGMEISAGSGSKVFGDGGVTPDDIVYQRHETIEGGGNLKLQEIFEIADNYHLSDDTFNDHILERHGSNSAYSNKSHFNADFDVKGGIDSTLRGDNFIVKPNTGNRRGYIFEQTFKNAIGVNSKGKPIYTLKVVIDESGNVITAFPKK